MPGKNGKCSEEHRAKISASMKGRKPWNAGLSGKSGQVAWNKGLPEEKQPFFGREHSDSTKQKMSRANLDRMDAGTHNWNQPWDNYSRDVNMKEYKDGVYMSPEMLEHFNAMNKE